MGYWRSKVLPTMKKLLEKFPSKKTTSGEACKPFDDSKEAINKEIEEKKTELGPKVVEIYEASSAEVKALVRNHNEADLKKHSAAVQKFLEDLVKIEFPGSKIASEVSSTLGATGPVTFIFEKVSLFLPAEEKSREIGEVVVKAEVPAKEGEIKTEEIIIAEKDKEIVEDKKKEEVITPPPSAPAVSPAAAPAEAPKAAPAEAPKAAPVVAGEEKKPVVEEVKKEAEAVPAVTAVKTLETTTVKAPETSTAKAPETSTVETPVKAPVTTAAVPPKA